MRQLTHITCGTLWAPASLGPLLINLSVRVKFMFFFFFFFYFCLQELRVYLSVSDVGSHTL